MPELNDMELLARFARDNSEEAFAALVARHVNMVYSVALRQTGDAHAAQEIVQAVFIIIARKARGLSRRVILAGWLFQTTRLTAANYLRTEMRRQNREQEAYMQSLANEPETHEAWKQIAPLLDDAISKLGECDRNAIVLRFFQNKNLGEIGASLGASEDAAKMRVNRALERLRKIFTKRGVTLSAVAIAGAASANSVQAAPVGLAVVVTAAAAKGTLISATLITLVKGTMKTMTWLKLKFAAGVGVLIVGGAVAIYSLPANNVAAAKFEFEIDGELTVQQIHGDKIISQESESFEVSVKDDKWFIVTIPKPGSQPAVMDRYEIGGENDAIYQVSYFAKKTLAPTSGNTAIGRIETATVPENIVGNQVAELWLAFASSHYLDGAKNGKLKPVYHMIDSSMRNEGWEDTAQWKRFDVEPRLPQTVDYINEKGIGVNGGRRLLIPLPPPFEKGFTRASYNVDSVTNIGGLTLPTSFSFKEHYVELNTRPAELKVMRIVRATVTNVRTVCQRTNFIPTISEPTYVGDDRFARTPQPIAELTYMVTNGVWPTTNVQWLKDSYQHELNVRAHMIKPIEQTK